MDIKIRFFNDLSQKSKLQVKVRHTLDYFRKKKRKKGKNKNLSPWRDSNSRPLVYKTSALTTELQRQLPQGFAQTTNEQSVPSSAVASLETTEMQFCVKVWMKRLGSIIVGGCCKNSP